MAESEEREWPPNERIGSGHYPTRSTRCCLSHQGKQSFADLVERLRAELQEGRAMVSNSEPMEQNTYPRFTGLGTSRTLGGTAMNRLYQFVAIVLSLVVLPSAWAEDVPSKQIAARTELHPIQPLTLSDQEFLKGDAAGSSAYAADAILAQPPQAQARYSAQFVIPHYLIVLDRAQTEASATTKMQARRQRVPDAAVIRSGNEFLIVAGSAPLSQADALGRATAIKREGIANPTLAPVRAP